MSRRIIVLGAGGFIGSHLVKRLKGDGHYVVGVDLKYPDHWETVADQFVIGDLRDPVVVKNVITAGVDEVYQLAADMGGAEYIFTGENDADIMHNSALININVVKECVTKKVGKVFYSSSACMYPAYNQLDPNNPTCTESSAYPAAPDSEYGWEKLFSERLYFAFNRNYGLDIRVARFHNIYGPYGTFEGGKEKAPAAMCRKVIRSKKEIEVFGDGKQTRSFLYIEDCLDAISRHMQSSFTGPLNIGSEEMVTINNLASVAIMLSERDMVIRNIPDALHVGVRGRTSDNRLIEQVLGWKPTYTLNRGMRETYNWIKEVYSARES